MGQVARELKLNIKTVSLWAKREAFERKKEENRPSLLDPFKSDVARWLEQHPFSVRQLLYRLREQGYTGGESILCEFVRKVRPRRKEAFLTLHFEPGECAQVDWGYAGTVAVGSTRRRLSFFVMVLCYSRKLYVEFTLGETVEQFLTCHTNAFDYFGGCPVRVMVDNLKSAVLSHPRGQPAVYNPRYLDFAQFHGFKVSACNPHAPHEKGRVENAVGYVKKNFLNGLPLTQFASVNPAARCWLEEVANVRMHAVTRKKPNELFALEKPALLSLPTVHYDAGAVRTISVNRRFRVHYDGNRYSVPAEYAGTKLVLRAYPERISVFHQDKLIAEHVRSYDRGQDFENADHVRILLEQRLRAKTQKLLQRFIMLSPLADAYYQQLKQRHLNPHHHVQKILALSEIYGEEKVVRALADATVFQAYRCEYIANLLEQQARLLPEAGALHLTRRQDLLELDLPQPDLNLYSQLDFPENDHE
ncbi:MAG: IS21 family transposase [bacterium]